MIRSCKKQPPARLAAASKFALAVFSASIFFAAPASAKQHKKSGPSIRAEDDPALAGDAPQFANAQLAFRSPADHAEVAAGGGVSLQLDVQGYALGPAPGAAAVNPVASSPAGSNGPFAILLVDNDAALRIDDASVPLRLTGLAPGPHLLRLVLSRPWGEVVKAKGAFAMTRFWVGPRAADDGDARAAEAKIWPDAKHAVLSYVFPLGELKTGYALAADAPAASEIFDGGTELKSPPANLPIPNQPALDFFLSGAQLKSKGRGEKVRVVIDKRELPIVRAWRPLRFALRPGRNRITIDLLDRRGTKVKNAVNRTDRFVVAPAAPSPP